MNSDLSFLSQQKVFPLTTLPSCKKSSLIMGGIAAVFAALSIFNLCLGAGIIASIPSIIWLLICASIVCSKIRNAQGTKNLLKNLLGFLFGRYFVSLPSQDLPVRFIQFGFYFGHYCFIQKTASVEDIKEVGWIAGQGSGMSGRDMNDWFVFVKLDESKYTGDSYFQLLGSSMKKSSANQLGLSFLDFLKAVGLDFNQKSEGKFTPK